MKNADVKALRTTRNRKTRRLIATRKRLEAKRERKRALSNLYRIELFARTDLEIEIEQTQDMSIVIL